MNWLSMLSEADKKTIVAEMANLLFNHVTDITPGKGLGSALETVVSSAVDASFARHGFRIGGTAASVVANTVEGQSARQRHQAQMLALANLVTWSNKASDELHPGDLRNKLELAIAAVEREFKQ